jgi:hypothetical protein
MQQAHQFCNANHAMAVLDLFPLPGENKIINKSCNGTILRLFISLNNTKNKDKKKFSIFTRVSMMN